MNVKNKRKIQFVSFVTVMLFVCSIYFFWNDNKDIKTISKNVEGDSLSFSVNAGIYEQDVTIEIKKASGVPFFTDIYYTLDGSEPTLSSNQYQGGITLRSGVEDQVIPLRAALFYRGERGDVYTHVYVMGEHVVEHYASVPTVFINGNEEELWGYEDGILVAGRDFDDYIEVQRAAGATEEILESRDIPANYNRDITRSINLSVFDENGECVINQPADLNVRGNMSRVYEQKSFKIKAETDFDYNFWDDGSVSGNELPLRNKYRVINLSNGGQDNQSTLVRDRLIESLAKQCGFADYTGVQPAVVYVNGMFYGTAILKEQYTDGYLSDLYSIPSEDIEILKGDEDFMLNYLGYGEGELDFLNDEFRGEFEHKVDIDQLISYYAFEMMSDNCDWPYNNIEFWRYTGEETQEGTMQDGKVRFLIYDMDQSFKLDSDSEDPFHLLLYNDPPAEKIDLLYQLLKYTPYREKFVNIVCDFMELAFNRDNLTTLVNESNLSWGNAFAIEAELTSFETKRAMVEKREENIDYLMSQVENREEEIKTFLWRYFDAEDAYYIKATAPEAGDIVFISQVPVYSQDAEKTILRAYGTPTTITASVGNGHVFDYWLVNGERYTDDTLTLDESDCDVLNHTASVSLVTKASDADGIQISEVSEAGDDDWVELYNAGETDVMLADYYLSDDVEELVKFQCPDVTLVSGETIWLNGESNPQLNEYIMNFNLKDGETLYLYQISTGQIADTLTIPDMSSGESYGRYLETNEFRFYELPTPKKSN